MVLSLFTSDNLTPFILSEALISLSLKFDTGIA